MSRRGQGAFQMSYCPELAASMCGSRVSGISTAHRCAPHSTQHTPTRLTLTVPGSLPLLLSLPFFLSSLVLIFREFQAPRW